MLPKLLLTLVGVELVGLPMLLLLCWVSRGLLLEVGVVAVAWQVVLLLWVGMRVALAVSSYRLLFLWFVCGTVWIVRADVEFHLLL